MVFVNSDLNKDYSSIIPEGGWIQCGVCMDLCQSTKLSQVCNVCEAEANY
jgi:hypothetical protein